MKLVVVKKLSLANERKTIRTNKAPITPISSIAPRRRTTRPKPLPKLPSRSLAGTSIDDRPIRRSLPVGPGLASLGNNVGAWRNAGASAAAAPDPCGECDRRTWRSFLRDLAVDGGDREWQQIQLDARRGVIQWHS